MIKMLMTKTGNQNKKPKFRILVIRTLEFVCNLGFGIWIFLLPLLSYAQDASTPLGQVSTFGELVSVLWAYGAQVIIGLAVFFVVLGALFYIASAGNEERISEGKQMVFGSLIAIVIVLLSGVFMRTLHKPAEGTAGVLGEVPKVIGNATSILVGLIGAFSVLMLAYGGILYITGRGDEDKLEKAHHAFRYALYGLIVGALAYALVNTLIQWLL